LRAIGLASETGDDLEITKVGDRFRCSYNWGADAQGTAIITTWVADSGFTTSLSSLGEPGRDPRKAPWFSHALEASGEEVTWSFADPSAPLMVYVSRMIHPGHNGSGYRIIRFALDPEALMEQINRPGGPPAILLTRIGRPWTTPADRRFGAVSAGAIAGWNAIRSRVAFRFTSGEAEHIARFVPHTLNGNTITCGAALPTAPLHGWLAAERAVLWISAAFLVIVGILLTIALIRGLRSYAQVQQQEKRSRTQQRALARAVDEREMLDREVHHRVKNNLQVVSSLLSLQAKRIAHAGARVEFARGKRRIDSMALVHHKLYTQKDLANIDLRLFLTQVSNAMSAMHEPRSRSVSHAVETHDIRADADTAIQLGVILCELLSNCYQHAFPYVTGGHVDIVVDRRPDDLYMLSVADNGRGMDPSAPRGEEELGLEIVEGLADQIDGTMQVSSDGGTRVEIVFRMQGRQAVRSL
jgi:two-component sensor histidine kinase